MTQRQQRIPLRVVTQFVLETEVHGLDLAQGILGAHLLHRLRAGHTGVFAAIFIMSAANFCIGNRDSSRQNLAIFLGLGFGRRPASEHEGNMLTTLFSGMACCKCASKAMMQIYPA